MADMPQPGPARATTGDAHLDELKADLAAVKADLAQLMQTLTRTARHGVDGASEEAEAAMGDVSEWAEGQYATLRDYIQEKPLTACAIAAGVGALLGQILLRR
ncbi:MAG: hypothetical protein AB1698_18055 [Pseudomonadota bacterium]|jgi:ElaB/YqjD/DUF883 family membrane-anchored ribosome-binding protein|nr:DUF883 family protein [Hyphomicrobiales bacterium]